MIVWIFQTGEQLPLSDGIRPMRTALLAYELQRRGHRVIWWASTFDHMRKVMVFDRETEIELRPDVTVRALKGLGYRSTVSLRRYLDHRKIAARFRRLAVSLAAPDLVIASTPDHHLAYEAVRFARARRVKTIVDIRDAWPDTFLEVIPRPAVPGARLLLRNDFAKIRYVVGKADSLVATMKSLLEWGLVHAGRKPGDSDRVFYLGAERPGADSGEPPPSVTAALRERPGALVATYIGTFGAYNNPSVIIEAARILAGAAILFVVAGHGTLYDKVAADARSLENVILPGWLTPREMNGLLAVSSIGIVPWSQGVAFPNKAFSCLAAGLPVLTSAEGDLKDVLLEYDAGAHFLPNDARRLADLLAALQRQPASRAAMAESAARLFEDRLESGRIYRAYADHAERIAAAQVV